MIYLVIINVLGFLIMGLDKAKAKKQKYRISENTLLFVALMGGSLGSYLGMYCFHHKTKHVKFYIGMPLILFIQILIYCFYFYTELFKSFNFYSILWTCIILIGKFVYKYKGNFYGKY